MSTSCGSVLPRRITESFTVAARLAGEQHLRLIDGHLAGGESGDFLDHVAHRRAGLGAGAIGKRGNHGDVAEALGEGEARRAFGFVRAFFFVIGIFERAHVAGLGIERIEQAVQGARGDLMEIGIVHVVALDVLEDLAVSGEGAEGFVVRGAAENVSGCDISKTTTETAITIFFVRGLI